MNYHTISELSTAPPLIQLYTFLLSQAQLDRGALITRQQTKLLLEDQGLREMLDHWYEDEFDGEDPYP